MSDSEFEGFNWSSNTKVRKHHNAIKIFHNHTTIQNDDGSLHERYTQLEHIPHPDPLISRRGFILNPQDEAGLARLRNIAATIATYEDPGKKYNFYTWRWKETPSGQVIISFCYEDQATLDRLRPGVSTAIALWHNKLGESSGIYLNDCLGVCRNPDIDTIWIKYRPGKVGATLGWSPEYVAQKHELMLDPSLMSVSRNLEGLQLTKSKGATWDIYCATLAHELGHIMGLVHEHQRPDALSHIRFDCQALLGYAAAKQEAIAGRMDS
ncbi:hypothetical protein EJ08DRAFT_698676 [Tothia fuscella]|uniref:Peptidase M12A domain-containing protein n=1 Tax=Tothia fuscella TaxID=1048955 RepID=A0A9P4TXC7_9PEZI|nr:hypothetical protein EJ08DRAFT_698676 [Tothia fuscella]